MTTPTLRAWPALACAAGLAGLAACSSDAGKPRERTVELHESVKIAVPPGTRGVRLWIPKPPNSPTQSAELIAVESSLPYRVTIEPEFGNETVFIQARAPIGRSLEARLRYRITRRTAASFQEDRESSPLNLTPRGLLVVNDEIRKIALRQTENLSDPLEKGRALYRYVLQRMSYDKSGQGWGRGDSVFACRVGKGNCTDFHSLFMALAMASGIPSRFHMGIAVPAAPAGALTGYHCWSEFRAKGSWIPVDISEAWKNPGLADFYFGQLDANRIQVSAGREIRLSPPQKGPRIHFLYRPYAEADGKPLYEIEFVRSFRNVGRAA